MSSSNARRLDSEADKNRSRRLAKSAPRRDERTVSNRNEHLPPQPQSMQQQQQHPFQMHQQHMAPQPLSVAAAQHAPQPLMAERRPPPGMAITFSGQAYSDAELLADIPRKKFIGRCRLFVGNLSVEVKEAELKELFTPHGDISECYLSGKGFAFLRLDTRAHAESAKEALDGKNIHGRQLRVRYAVHGATIKVKELSPAVSNEMLYLAFTAFGEVERAVHIVDEKGKPTGEGIIEFERKLSAQEAIAQIRERVFLMTANSRPLIAEFSDQKDEEDGLPEKIISRSHHLAKERELGPRFAQMNSFEYVYGRRWKELYEFERKRRAEVEAELREQRRRLDADMEAEYEDYKAQMLREELQRRQEELERLEASRQIRRQQMQQQQLLGAGMMLSGWEPQLVDGPLGRNMPPTFGPGGGAGAGAPPPQHSRGGGGMPLMMMDKNAALPSSLMRPTPGGGMPGLGGGGGGGGNQQHHHHPPSLVGGGNTPAASRRDRGDVDERNNASAGGPGGLHGLLQQNGRGPSPPQGPDVRKLLQGFRATPPQQQQQQGGRLQQHQQGGGQLPPGLSSLFGGGVPMLQNHQQQQHHHQQQQQQHNQFGVFFLPHGAANGGGSGPPPPGGRIPPPPSPMGGGGVDHYNMPPPPASLLSVGGALLSAGGGSDYSPLDKKPRH